MFKKTLFLIIACVSFKFSISNADSIRRTTFETNFSHHIFAALKVKESAISGGYVKSIVGSTSRLDCYQIGRITCLLSTQDGFTRNEERTTVIVTKDKVFVSELIKALQNKKSVDAGSHKIVCNPSESCSFTLTALPPDSDHTHPPTQPRGQTVCTSRDVVTYSYGYCANYSNGYVFGYSPYCPTYDTVTTCHVEYN